jgi:hypothetical protein
MHCPSSGTHDPSVTRDVGLSGRQAERAALDRLADSVRAGRGAALVVRGEAGVGKTALLDDLAARARGCLIVRLAGVEAETEWDFAALQRVCAALPDQPRLLPGPQQQALSAAFGLRDAAVSPDRLMIGLATASLLAQAAAGRPVICLIDDAQWLDAASAQALAFAARRLAAVPAALVFALRLADPGRDFACLPELAVPALPDSDARELLDSLLIGPVKPGVGDRMLAEARGNPGRLLEAARAQSPEELAGGFGLPPAVPAGDTAAAALRRHLDTLPPAARRLLLVAAAEPAGDPALIRQAAAQLGVQAAATSAAVAEIADFGDIVRFRHGRDRSAVYWAASPSARQEVHRALAEDIGPRPDTRHMAWHLAHAFPEPDEYVASTVEDAAVALGGLPVEGGGLPASAAFYELAATRTPDAARRARRALAAARAAYESGAPDSALRLLALAEAGPLDPPGRARATLLRAQLSASRAPGPDGARLLLEAAGLGPGQDPGLAWEAYRDALHAALTAGRLGGDGDLLTVAAAIRATTAARPPSPASLADELAVLVTEGLVAGGPRLRETLRGLRDRREPGGAQDGTRAETGWLPLACRAARDLGDAGTWSALSGRLIDEARRAGALRLLPAALHDGALARVLAGDFDAAAALAREAEAAAPASGDRAAPYGSLALAAWRGQDAEVARLAESTTAAMLARGEGEWLTAVGWATSLLGNGLGRPDQALAAAEEAAGAEKVTADGDRAAAAAAGRPGGLGLAAWSLAELAEAAARLGEPGRARAAVARLRAIATASGADWTLGLAARSLALVSGDESAEDHYQEAIRLLGRAGVPAELARARLLYGEWLRRRERRMDARGQLRESYRALSEIGAAGFAARAGRELMATGEPGRKRTHRRELREVREVREARPGLGQLPASAAS